MADSIAYSILIAPAAADRLDEHMRYLARVHVTASERLYYTLYEDIHSLAFNPSRCPVYTSKATPPISPLRYLLSGKRYRIVFGVKDRTVFVFDVQDRRQDANKNIL